MAVYDGAVDGSGIYTHALRVQNVTYPLLTNAILQTYYNTDSSIDGRLQRARYIKLFDGDLLTGDVTQTARYEYNGTGRVVRVETYSGGTVDLERTMATATGVYGHWDRFGRTRTQRWFRSTTTHDEVTNQHYDYAGNRLYRDIPDTLYAGNDLDQAYEYDGLQRLANFQQGTIASGVIINKNFAQDWTLDQLGNWPTFKQDNDGNGTWEFIQNRTHTLANEVTGISTWVNPVYDAVGNMTTMPQPFNPADDFAATYDAWNRLVELDDGEDLQVAYEYDGLHHRIQKNIDTITWDYYYNDQWQLLTEAVNEQVEAIYAWHPYYIDALAIRFDDSERHVFLHDANFNVTAAFDVRPSSSTYRQVVERYTYTPYGEVTFLNADFSVKTTQKSDIDNNHLYTGRERDPETGLQLNRNRFLHAPLGRWTTRDPIGYATETHSLYEYVSGCPTFYVDPSGLRPPTTGTIELWPPAWWHEGPFDDPYSPPPIIGTPVLIPPKLNSIECRDGKLNVKIGNPDGADECTKVHEEQHMQDWYQRYGDCLCQKVRDGYLPVGGEGYEDFIKKSECEAHKKGKACREKLLKSGTAADPELTKRKLAYDIRMIEKYCKEKKK